MKSVCRTICRLSRKPGDKRHIDEFVAEKAAMGGHRLFSVGGKGEEAR